ncbi:ATP-binding protein, putative [Medicago truncatula]|uniref:ATP-binding protein, putative n=1 Tax=Medicago truncatula TaxID=3880 RepID=A0A072U459_MEDTR|nr:ATP-binding protein, putative [Medicago truncatula]
MKTDVEKKFKVIYYDVFLMWEEILHFMNSFRSSVEDICSQTVDVGFESFALYSCCLTELVSQFANYSVDHDLQSARQRELHNLPKTCSSIAEPVPSMVNEGTGTIDYHHLLIQNVQEEPDLPSESTSDSKEIKDQIEKLIFSLSQARYELELNLVWWDIISTRFWLKY